MSRAKGNHFTTETNMHRFKNNVSDGWIFRQELRFFENLARNWDRDVEDCDFFDPFGNGNNSDSAEATALFKKFFPLETLAKLDGISVERSCSRPWSCSCA
jgi:hypothetical protein